MAPCVTPPRAQRLRLVAALVITASLAATAGVALPAAATTPADGGAVVGGVGLVTITGTEPGTAVTLSDAGGAAVAAGTSDILGALVFRGLEPGAYEVAAAGAPSLAGAVTVLGVDDHPDPALYDQPLGPSGDESTFFGYFTTRDGTSLSYYASLPGPADEGPYPTLVEYSGYGPSDPEGQVFSPLINALGYAYVGVNMRGSGCSDGVYYYFDPAQLADGYDAVETVAAQPWVLGNRVGMTGVSYPGISQLFVAQTQPPSLVAVAPFSVIDDSYRAVLSPGGILNTGFGINWLRQRLDENRYFGQAWTERRVTELGDTQCAANQRLRFQNPDLIEAVTATGAYEPELHDAVAPRLFVDRIDVPVLVSGAWQDEQTGSHFATMLDRFTGTDHFYVTLSNGLHTESVGLGSLPRMVEFYDLYVAERVPSLDGLRPVAPILAESIFGTDQVDLPPDRFAGMTYEEALAAFENEPPVLLNLEEGAAESAVPGAPVPRASVGLDGWPASQTEVRRWTLAPETLLDESPAADAAVDAGAAAGDDTIVSYQAVPTAPATFFDASGGQSVWDVDVAWQWQQPDPATVASFVSAPMTESTILTGSGSVDLWIRIPETEGVTDTDLEVTLTELRPDGTELMIQSGWLRASHRALDADESTELMPVQTHLAADQQPLVPGEWTPVRVEIFPFAHPLREGSQLRLLVGAPGGNRAEWVFDTIAAGERVEIATGADHPSSLVLGTLDPAAVGLELPAEAPACTLRGQPCRPAP